METEQVESVEGEITPAGTQSISEILQTALKGDAGTPTETTEQAEETSQPDTPVSSESAQVADKKQDKVFGEIVFGENQKVSFKSEEDFKQFLEANPLLKEGWLRHQDYTRKTTLVSDDRKKLSEEKAQFEQQRAKDAQIWGNNPPDDNSKQFFSDFWNVFQYGSPDLANKLNEFARDVQLIANGKNPMGPLASKQADGQVVNESYNPQLISLQRQFDQYRSEQERKERESLARQQQELNDQAEDSFNNWMLRKSKEGITVQDDEREAMGRLSGIIDAIADRERKAGKPFSWDSAWDSLYQHALTDLGRTEKLAIKKVIQKSEAKANASSLKPSSSVSADKEPIPKSIGDILRQGAQKLGT